MEDSPEAEVDAQAAALGDASRRAVYRHLVDAAAPVAVADLAGRFQLTENAVRKHLAVLRHAGLVDGQPEERRTRGRPRLLYQARVDVLGSWGRGGSYELLALMLAELHRDGSDPYEVGRRHGAQSRRAGIGRAEARQDLWQAFSAEGFVPCEAGDTIVLDRCGLARVAAVDDGITCELHRGLIDGLLEGRGTEHVVRLRTKEPYAAGCEVHLPAGHPDDPSTDHRRC